MTAREPDPIQPKLCPRCAKPDAVTETTAHEADRTGCGWWCDRCRLAFEGTASEFQRIQARMIADEAERMSTRPRPTDGEDQ